MFSPAGVEGLQILPPSIELIHGDCCLGVLSTSDDKCILVGVLDCTGIAVIIIIISE